MRTEDRVSAEGVSNVMFFAWHPRNCKAEVEQLLPDVYEPLVVEHVKRLVENTDERPVVGLHLNVG